MLLEFKTKNYKSFKEETVFSMIAAPKQKGLDYSVLNKKVGKSTYKVLSSAVIYGPNASGKTNLIGAMDAMRAIVLRGNIKNTNNISSPNSAAFSLELIPGYNRPMSSTMFAIKFIDSDIVIDYSFSVDLGEFLNQDYPRKILNETLYINEEVVFERGEELTVQSHPFLDEHWNVGAKNNFQSAIEIAQSGLNPEELFLSNGFKTIFSKDIVSFISEWFDKKFIVIYRSDSIQTMRNFADPKSNTIYVEKTLTEAAKAFGINSNALGYRVSEDGKDSVLCSAFQDFKNRTDIPAIPADIFESYGTVRFINEFPLVINALLNGGTLVMDEFDASIHPMALMNIINIFHNDDINKHHAQLIFNTHNPIFLNSGLFRRDEIKFVERDDDTHESSHYSLSDFKTAGKNGVRNGDDYMRNYFISQYGAIKNIDFSPILESIMDQEGEMRNG